jgi:hypothetical protein
MMVMVVVRPDRADSDPACVVQELFARLPVGAEAVGRLEMSVQS